MVFYKLKDKSVNNSELSNLVNLESHFFFLLIPRNANYFSTSHRVFMGPYLLLNCDTRNDSATNNAQANVYHFLRRCL